MSSPVSIPRRSGARAASSPSAPGSSSSHAHGQHGGAGSAASSAASSFSYLGCSANTPAVPSPLRTASFPDADTSGATPGRAGRRASLMSSALAASEHTVINVGGPDEPPRLISCVRSSQGFDWNQEIFLPSHYDHLISQDLERKRDPVHDIVLTDEDMLGIFPQ